MTTQRVPSPLAPPARLGHRPAGARVAGPGSPASTTASAFHIILDRLVVPLGVTGLLLAALLVYLPSLGDFFAADDFVFLQAANRHELGEYARRALTFPHAEPFDLETPFWRPLVDAYFFAWWHLFGLNPLPYHLANIALHGAVAALLAALAWQLTGARLTALLAGTLFVVMPTHDYTVTWISDITELLGACWYMVALVAYATFLRGGGHSPWPYAGAVAATTLAFLSKQSSATVLVPLAGLALLLYPPQDRRAWRRRAVELAPFAALTACFVALIAMQEYPRYAAAGWFGPGEHLLGHWWDYLRWLTFPFGETTPASRQVLSGPLTWFSHLTALAFLALGPVAWRCRRPLLAALPLWALVSFAPYVSATRPIEPRYAYLATVPLCLALALLAREVGGRLARRARWRPALPIAAASIVLIVLALAAQTRERQHWMRDQARAYERLFVEAPAACGPLSPGSRLYLAADPFLWDFLGGFSSMALNLVYADVAVEPLPADAERPFLDSDPAACVVHYSDGRYQRLAPDGVRRPAGP